MMKSRNIKIKSVMSLTTDGAPAMLARGKGLVSHFNDVNVKLQGEKCTIFN